MPDRIVLRGIQATGRHGVLDFEQERSQPFEVDIEIEADLAKAATSDDLSKTIDYGSVVQAVKGTVEEHSYRLLEALAGAVAEEVLAFDKVTSVTVEVRKLRPPVAAGLASVGVRITRARA